MHEHNTHMYCFIINLSLTPIIYCIIKESKIKAISYKLSTIHTSIKRNTIRSYRYNILVIQLVSLKTYLKLPLDKEIFLKK